MHPRAGMSILVSLEQKEDLIELVSRPALCVWPSFSGSRFDDWSEINTTE